MTDLAEFLLARIAEDEAANRPGPEPESWCDRGEGLHLSYARVLAECAAKRRIVDAWAAAERAAGSYPGTLAGIEQGLDLALTFLALPYADHPDYREEWKP